MSAETRLAIIDDLPPEPEDHELAERISIPDLVATFQAAERDIRTSFAAIAAGMGRLEALGIGGRYLRLHTRHDTRHSFEWSDPTEVIAELRRDVWETLIERMQIRRAMSIKTWEELKKQIEQQDPPEITIENVEGMIAQFRAEAPAMLKEAVDEVFNLLRPRMSEYKTNTEFEIGERVVLNNFVHRGYGSKWDVNHYRSQDLIALENVFRMVAGVLPRQEGGYYSDLQAAIESIPNADPCRGETEFFEFKGHKKGTLHVRFRRLDLVAKLNAIAGGARLKPAQAVRP